MNKLIRNLLPTCQSHFRPLDQLRSKNNVPMYVMIKQDLQTKLDIIFYRLPFCRMNINMCSAGNLEECATYSSCLIGNTWLYVPITVYRSRISIFSVTYITLVLFITEGADSATYIKYLPRFSSYINKF